jgi:hypothetical protein
MNLQWIPEQNLNFKSRTKIHVVPTPTSRTNHMLVLRTIPLNAQKFLSQIINISTSPSFTLALNFPPLISILTSLERSKPTGNSAPVHRFKTKVFRHLAFENFLDLNVARKSSPQNTRHWIFSEVTPGGDDSILEGSCVRSACIYRNAVMVPRRAEISCI